MHGIYLIAIGTMMARHAKTAAVIVHGHYDDELRNLMIARGATVEEANAQLEFNPNDAINAQF
jgi:hypothetical protein